MGGDEFVVLIDGASLDGGARAGRRTPAGRDAPAVRARRRVDAADRQHQHRDRHRRPGRPPGSCCATPTSRCTRPRPRARTATRSSTRRCRPRSSHRVELEFDLRSALEGDQFRLVYQPIYNLDDLTLVGVEALLRWDHPDAGARRSPTSSSRSSSRPARSARSAAGCCMEACRQMAAWHAQGDTLDISVNVSGRQLDNDDIVDRHPRRPREQRARRHVVDHRGDRDRAHAQRRRHRAAAPARSRSSASGSPSTTSAPATRRSPTSSSSPSTASRSTARSPTRSPPHPNRRRSSAPSCSSARTSA